MINYYQKIELRVSELAYEWDTVVANLLKNKTRKRNSFINKVQLVSQYASHDSLVLTSF